MNLVEESIQIGESCTEKAQPSCSCRNLIINAMHDDAHIGEGASIKVNMKVVDLLELEISTFLA